MSDDIEQLAGLSLEGFLLEFPNHLFLVLSGSGLSRERSDRVECHVDRLLSSRDDSRSQRSGVVCLEGRPGTDIVLINCCSPCDTRFLQLTFAAGWVTVAKRDLAAKAVLVRDRNMANAGVEVKNVNG